MDRPMLKCAFFNAQHPWRKQKQSGFSRKALHHALLSKSKTTILEAYESLANTYGMKSMWDKAIEYSDQCLLIASEIKYRGPVKCLQYAGAVQFGIK
ncbi:MAG: hypothetical protein IPK46_21680 [Saprospiraceae bacterium]|nr:hypothetical protein [Saprospiraceae bacterium]